MENLYVTLAHLNLSDANKYSLSFMASLHQACGYGIFKNPGPDIVSWRPHHVLCGKENFGFYTHRSLENSFPKARKVLYNK